MITLGTRFVYSGIKQTRTNSFLYGITAKFYTIYDQFDGWPFLTRKVRNF